MKQVIIQLLMNVLTESDIDYLRTIEQEQWVAVDYSGTISRFLHKPECSPMHGVWWTPLGQFAIIKQMNTIVPDWKNMFALVNTKEIVTAWDRRNPK